MIKRLLGALIGLLVAGVAVLAITGGPLADIKPDGIATTLDPQAEAKGRAILAKAYAAHGGDAALRSHRTATVEFSDAWVGLNKVFSPWPAATQDARMTMKVHSFDSEADLLNGPDAGLTWGITDRRAWSRKDGTTTVAPNPGLEFILPTVHYFFEMPQRLTEAGLVQYVGEETIGGTLYDVVYLTWESLDARPDFDQYLAYFDRGTGRLSKIKYTVREIAKMVTGTMHLDDQRQIDGWWVPFKQSVTQEPTDDPDAFIHRITVTSFAFDAHGITAAE